MPASTRRSPRSLRSSAGGRRSLISLPVLQDPRTQVVLLTQDPHRRFRLRARPITADVDTVDHPPGRAIAGDGRGETVHGETIPDPPGGDGVARRIGLHD